MNDFRAKYAKPKSKSELAKGKQETVPITGRIPHVTKLMALAIRLDSLLDSGLVANQTEIAKTVGITTARVTQILNLTYLAPDIQQDLLELKPTTDQRDPFLERNARTIARNFCWVRQRREFKKLKEERCEALAGDLCCPNRYQVG